MVSVSEKNWKSSQIDFTVILVLSSQVRQISCGSKLTGAQQAHVPSVPSVEWTNAPNWLMRKMYLLVDYVSALSLFC